METVGKVDLLPRCYGVIRDAAPTMSSVAGPAPIGRFTWKTVRVSVGSARDRRNLFCTDLQRSTATTACMSRHPLFPDNFALENPAFSVLYDALLDKLVHSSIKL